MELPAAPGDYLPKTFEQLARESDVVVQTKLVRVKSYLLAPSEDRVLSDYRLASPKVLAGAFKDAPSSAPGPGAPVTIIVYGGEIELEGVHVRATDYNRAPIVEGRHYLLFLRQSRLKGPGLYEIHYGGIFEVASNRLNPLLKRGDEVFVGSKNASLPELIDALFPVAQLLWFERLPAWRYWIAVLCGALIGISLDVWRTTWREDTNHMVGVLTVVLVTLGLLYTSFRPHRKDAKH